MSGPLTWTTALSNSVKLWDIPCRVTQDGWVSGEFWQNVVHWRREWQTTSVFLPWEPQWTIWKGKMTGYWKWSSPGLEVPNMLLEIRGEIAPERTKGQSQSKNNTQLWVGLVIEARSDAVKSNTAQEPGMLGPWVKANWKWSNRR